MSQRRRDLLLAALFVSAVTVLALFDPGRKTTIAIGFVVGWFILPLSLGADARGRRKRERPWLSLLRHDVRRVSRETEGEAMAASAGQTVRLHVPVMVTVEKGLTNEATGDGWVPSPVDVAEEIAHRVAGRDLDTGWEIVKVSAKPPRPCVHCGDTGQVTVRRGMATERTVCQCRAEGGDRTSRS